VDINQKNIEWLGDISPELLPMLAKATDLGIITVRADDAKVLFANHGIRALLQVAESESSFTLQHYFPALYHDIVSGELKKIEQYELRTSHTNTIEVNALLVPDKSSSHSSLSLIIWKQHAKLIESNELEHAASAIERSLLERILQFSPTGIIYLDGQWNCLYANQKLSLLSELSLSELMGPGWTSMFAEQDELLKGVIANLINKREFKGDLILRLPDQDDRYLEFHLKAYPQHQPEVEYIIGSFIDVTDQEAKNDKIYRLATFDRNTGLYNRAALREQLARYLGVATRLYQTIHVALIGINSFKRFNDFFGHQVGDEVLRAVGVIIKSHVRITDIVAKVAGDEFAVLIPGDVSEEKLQSTLNSLINKLSQPHELAGSQVNLTFSIGVTSFTGSEDSKNIRGDTLMNDIFRQADIALMKAKNDNMTSICRYTSSQGDELVSLYAIVQQLPKAILERQFRVYYQPIFSSKDLAVSSAEALIRWNSPILGMVGPDHFIPVAESQNLIEEVEECVLEEVAKELTVIRQACDNHELRITINLSGQQLCNLKLLTSFFEKLESLSIDPNQVTLEITEQVLVIESNDVLGHMQLLKSKGFRFALDDFGTGFSSLSYLTRFPIDYLKLDKSFIAQEKLDSKQCALIEGVIALSKKLNLEVVAEGIETKEQLDYLRKVGCEYIQGYYLGRPMPTETFQINRQPHG
jgi:diguanylate cyclase (GGDEF)-like protein/PAS domain S-box-containing protein